MNILKTMTSISFIFLSLFLVFGGSWAMGLRIHPEVLGKNFHPGPAPQWVRLDLKTGKSMIGRLVREDERGIKIRFEGGSFVFSKQEVQKLTRLEPKDLGENLEEEEAELMQKKSLFTFRSQDSIFYKDPHAPPAQVVASKAVAPRGDGLSQGLGSLVKIMETFNSQSARLRQYQKEMEGADRTAEADRPRSKYDSEDEASSRKKVDATIDTGFEYSNKSKNSDSWE